MREKEASFLFLRARLSIRSAPGTNWTCPECHVRFRLLVADEVAEMKASQAAMARLRLTMKDISDLHREQATAENLPRQVQEIADLRSSQAEAAVPTPHTQGDMYLVSSLSPGASEAGS